MPITDFPLPGGDKQPSLRNSQYPSFPVGYAQDLKDNWPDIWDEGGNIRGNQQFDLLSPMASEGRGPANDAEEEAVRLREAWAARHLEDFQLAGVVAQIKWLVIGSRGLDHMKSVIEEAKNKVEQRDIDKPHQVYTTADLIANHSAKSYEFVISTNAIDRHGETVDQEGWDFSNWLVNPVILDSHKYDSIDDIIGRGIGYPKRTENGWSIGIEFADTPKGMRAKALVDARMLRTVSVGFRSLKRVPSDGVMKHTKMELLEVSLVAVPANPQAVRIKGVHMEHEKNGYAQAQLIVLRELRDNLLVALSKVSDMILACEMELQAPEEPEEAPMEPVGPAAPEMPSMPAAPAAPQVDLTALKQLLAAFKSNP